jgi:NAD(P)-dependent dehydrogenase (short-subunit alcohol dehydrogenase family)
MSAKRLVLVTGASQGIGSAIAQKCVEAGYEVAGCSRSGKQAGKVRMSAVDVRDRKKLAAWIEREIDGTKAAPWGLVTAAGIHGDIGPFVDAEFEPWAEAIEVNLYGTAFAAQTFARALIKRKLPGRIVMLSGGAATRSIPNMSAYGASKTAVVRFCETLADELKAHRIAVNAIAPGGINTALTDTIIKAGPEKAGRDLYEKTVKQKAEGGIEADVPARCAEYLLSDDGGAVTGRLIAAVWDDWKRLHELKLEGTDTYKLRRVVLEGQK